MKNLLKFYILIFSFCFAFSQEKSFKVTELTLDNGLKVMLTENSESSDVLELLLYVQVEKMIQQMQPELHII